MKYHYTETTELPTTLEHMTSQGWRVHTYHITTSQSLNYIVVKHHVLWERDDEPVV